ncbi:ATPase AAA [Sorangium cellulosum]|uniref:ATPase AAA n=1 Tax=Sorangium cellulosum TaxID=56 RepID=A0A4P2Q072_SORCE|nr:sigma 54-interacting transcriptional regulator [Sorangium cellulosum]AUX22597.1 ATPase AAA [Sorangium cellulosum]
MLPSPLAASMHDATRTITTLRSDAVEVPDLRIVVTPQKGPPIEAPLGVAPLVLGTSAECDVVIPDARVSRRHCQIRLSPRGIVVTDLGSKNGTFINDVLVHEGFLTPRAIASLGGVSLTVRVCGAPVLVPLSTSASFGEALGGSVPMRALFARLERAAATSETILLLGESGTGKEVLARAIHDASPRRGGPFVVLDCSAVAPGLIEAELFGYTRGAFTGAQTARAGLLEEANGGTLFLDELGELPLDLQPKLLRALEARQVRRVGAAAYTSFDARIVAATHRDLQGRVASGAFREDLYYRLAVVEAVVPPLRERKDDIPLLVERFLAAQAPPRSLDDLPPNALELLKGHHWPGNVRELRNTVARLVLFPHLAEQAIVKVAPRVDDMGVGPLAALTLREARDMVVEQFERRFISTKLREHGGNVARAAASMGVSRQLVHRLMDRYGIRSRD